MPPRIYTTPVMIANLSDIGEIGNFEVIDIAGKRLLITEHRIFSIETIIVDESDIQKDKHIRRDEIHSGRESTSVQSTIFTYRKISIFHNNNIEELNILGNFALNLCKDLVSIENFTSSLELEINEGITLENITAPTVISIPKIQDIHPRVESIIQKFGHSKDLIIDFITRIYEINSNNRNKIELAILKVESIEGKESRSAKLMAAINNLIKEIFEIRSCVEHRSESKFINITGIDVNQGGEALEPRIRIVYNDKDRTFILRDYIKYILEEIRCAGEELLYLGSQQIKKQAK